MTPTRASEARRKLDEAICHAGNHAFVPGSVLMALAEFERAALAPHAGTGEPRVTTTFSRMDAMQIIAGFDERIFLRNTEDDDQSGWAMR